MRVVAAVACALVLAACGDRRSFDERYNDAGSELEQRARAIDQNIANELPPEEPADGNRAS
jgi:hypothetical protein